MLKIISLKKKEIRRIKYLISELPPPPLYLVDEMEDIPQYLSSSHKNKYFELYLLYKKLGYSSKDFIELWKEAQKWRFNLRKRYSSYFSSRRKTRKWNWKVYINNNDNDSTEEEKTIVIPKHRISPICKIQKIKDKYK